MKGNKGLRKMKMYDLSILLLILAVIATGGIVSQFFMGADNPLEEAAEEIIETQIEARLGLSDGSINIDLSPGSEETGG